MVLLRPDGVRLADGPLAPGDCRLTVRLVDASWRGVTRLIRVQTGETRLAFHLPGDVVLPPVGEALELDFDPMRAVQILAGGS
jgi:hypothetical protein